MSLIELATLISISWFLGVVVCLFQLHAAKLEGKRPANARLSAMPVIPLFPAAAFGAAVLANGVIPRWGTWIVGGLHVVLAVAHMVGIVLTMRRIRFVKPPAA